MQEFNIVGKTTVTAEVKAQVDNSPLALPPPQGMGAVEDFQLFTEAQNESTDSMKQYTSLMKEFGNVMPDIIKQLRAMNDAVARTSQNLPAIGKVKTSEEQKKQRIEDLNRQNLLGIANNGSNLVQSYANGNVSGMALTGVNAVANTSNNLSKMAEAADMTNLAKGLVAGGVVAAIAGAVIKGGDVLAEKFIQEMPVVYAARDVFVQPSLIPESFGRSIAEAEAMNRVVVAAAHGGACELIEDGKTGFLTPVGDSTALAIALDKVLDMTPEERVLMGERAAQNVQTHFTIQRMCEKTLELYETFLKD